ncbi:hypothetical protein Ancab_018972 [Ancistrocladus abbreviatus]
MEEEKRKAEERAVDAVQRTVGNEDEPYLVEAVNGTGAELVDERPQRSISKAQLQGLTRIDLSATLVILDMPYMAQVSPYLIMHGKCEVNFMHESNNQHLHDHSPWGGASDVRADLQKGDLGELDGDLVTAFASSESSIDSDDLTDSRMRSPLISNCDNGMRTTGGSLSRPPGEHNQALLSLLKNWKYELFIYPSSH